MKTNSNAKTKLPTNGGSGLNALDMRELLHALQAVRDGDFSVRLPGDRSGLEGKIADTFNQIVAANGRMAEELERVGHVVGKQGKTRQRVKIGRSSGSWGAMESSVAMQLDASTAQLRKSEERLRLVLDSAGAAAWDWDVVADRFDWTERYRRLFGFADDEEAVFKTWLGRVHPDDRERLNARLQRMFDTPGDDVWNEEFRIVHPLLGVHWLGGLGRAARDETGRVVRMTGMNLDITERKRLEEALKEGDRRKDEFLAMLAHELRNPIAPICNAVQIMRLKMSEDADLLWCRDVIARQVEHLTRIVDDLLDVSRITRGKVKLQKVPIELAAIVARAVETNRPLIDERRHELTIDMRDPSLKVAGDLIRLAQVVGNLLNNAAKYTGEGGHIHLSIESDPEPGGDGERRVAEAVIRVKDTGVGIPAEMLPKVFGLFTQVERTLDRAEGGLGIGLALVQSLVEMHGGRVEAHSKGSGQGSEFVVRLPCSIGEPSEHPPQERGPAHPPVGPALRILLVDDNRDVAGSMAMLLRLGGHEVFMAHDGAKALEVAAAERPGVILLDIGLPGMDGYEVCRRLRRQVLSEALIVAMTGYGQAEDRQRSLEAGFDAHQIKPVDHAELMKLLVGSPARVPR